jgi:hypothetical protein
LRDSGVHLVIDGGVVFSASDSDRIDGSISATGKYTRGHTSRFIYVDRVFYILDDPLRYRALGRIETIFKP